MSVPRPHPEPTPTRASVTETNSGGTDHVWFYDVQADGFSLDDKRSPVDVSDLPDVLARWCLGRGFPSPRWALLHDRVTGRPARGWLRPTTGSRTVLARRARGPSGTALNPDIPSAPESRSDGAVERPSTSRRHVVWLPGDQAWSPPNRLRATSRWCAMTLLSETASTETVTMVAPSAASPAASSPL